MPTACEFRPVSNEARVAEQIDRVWKFVKRSPWAASESIPGVAISAPNGPSSAYPVSSSTMYTTLGLPAGAVTTGSGCGGTSAVVRPADACWAIS
jgi:hypothetical protein